MKILEPRVELTLQGPDELAALEHVAMCASVCYNSKPKKAEKAIQMTNDLIKKNHLSPFRHESVYYIIPASERYFIFDQIDASPYVEFAYDNESLYMSTNGQYVFENRWLDKYKKYQVAPAKFNATDFGHNLMRYTFKVQTMISISRELNRKSPNAITESSTRYIAEQQSIVRPHWMTRQQAEYWNTYGNLGNPQVDTFLAGCEKSFETYNQLRDLGLTPQDARGVLPLDTATWVYYTYSVNEWKNIINLRYYGTTGVPHPNAAIIAGLIRDELNQIGYNI